MSYVLEYKGYYKPLDSLPSEILEEWETTLKNERERILSALTEKIPNADAFISKIAEPAYEGWSNFVNPDFPDVDFIKLKYRIKLKSAYPAWNSGIQSAFAEGGTFETNVSAKKDKLEKLRYVLGAVGYKRKIGWGPAYKAIAVITGDRRVDEYFTTDDSFSGEITNAFPTGVVKYVRPMAIAILTQGFVLAQYAHENGLTTERDAVISKVNTVLDNSVEKLIDTTKYSALEMKIDYDGVADKLYVLVQLSPVS